MKNLWIKWRRPANGKKKAAARPACCLVDGSALLNLRGSARADPRDMVGVLQRVGRWASREGLAVEVYFDADPLRKAPEGESVGGVLVGYAANRAALAGLLCARIKSVRRKGFAPVLITRDEKMEQDAAALGAECLRASTLRKVLDGGAEDRNRGGGESREHGSGSRGGRRRRGNRRPSGPSAEKPARAEPAPMGDPVRTLIDVVE